MHGPTVRSRRSQARLARSLLALAIAAPAVVMPASAASPLAPPPPTGFVVMAADASSISVAWNPSPDLTVTGYGLYRNGAFVASTSQTTYRFTGLACGASYTLGVDAVNLLGFRSDPTTISAATRSCPDTTPPSTPTGLAASPGQVSISLSWNASTDNVGVAGYGVYRGGTGMGSTPTTSFTFTGLTCGTSYTLGVDAFDAAGNRSAPATLTVSTTACSATPPANTSPPAISGTAQVGRVLTASTGTWSGTTPMSFAYAWLQCDTAGAGCTGIAGATSSSYTPASGDQGHTIRVRVTASNSAGSSAATSAQTAVVQPTATASGLHVSGNQLLDANGNVVRLHGVNRSGPEYACIQGWGIFDGPSDAASAQAIRSWNSNVVHLGLNEDCILGINGVPAAYSGANYMNAIVNYVNLLHQNGLYAEVSLMWAAPGSQQAQDHPPILDQDHSPAALQAIANAFKDDPKTFIGLQSEPHDISWACWLNGGSSCSVGYAALGMQGALNAVRSTGATNVVTASGIDYANNLSQWLAFEPSDPLNQLMAEAHVYGKNACSSTSCFNADYAPVANSVPVVFGETGETFDASSCGSTNVSTFMSWADQHGVGYEAWVWETWGNCSALISDYGGTPANAYGTWVKNHYATLP